jgi:hypothetical protein
MNVAPRRDLRLVLCRLQIAGALLALLLLAGTGLSTVTLAATAVTCAIKVARIRSAREGPSRTGSRQG